MPDPEQKVPALLKKRGKPEALGIQNLKKTYQRFDWVVIDICDPRQTYSSSPKNVSLGGIFIH